MNQIPVFVCLGFLDAGKTSFLLDTIENDGFKEQGHTLLLVCEEGETEYEPAFLKNNNTSIEYIKNVSELNKNNLTAFYQKYKPVRVLLEFNGMWDFSLVEMPENFVFGQIVSFVDFTTFPQYFLNMRQMMVNMFKVSDIVVFTRCDDKSLLIEYQTALRLINANTTYFILDTEGRGEIAFEDPLPYDIEADVIEVSAENYGRWYIDVFDHKERYLEKTISIKCMVFTSPQLEPGTFVAGRLAMTCCEDDIQLFGHLCLSSVNKKIQDKDWIHVVFKFESRISKEYGDEELVMVPITLDIIANQGDPILRLA